MRATFPTHRPRSSLPAILLALVAFPVLGAPAAATAEPKPYTLFLGSDLEIQRDKEFCRVQDVQGDYLIASVNGKTQAIPTTGGPINLRVQRSLKLASTTLTIANLKSDRVYTPANDPEKKFAREQPGWTGQAQYDLAQ